jgi:hypothetical protein
MAARQQRPRPTSGRARSGVLRPRLRFHSWRIVHVTSALPPKVDIRWPQSDVCFVPEADIAETIFWRLRANGLRLLNRMLDQLDKSVCEQNYPRCGQANSESDYSRRPE